MIVLLELWLTGCGRSTASQVNVEVSGCPAVRTTPTHHFIYCGRTHHLRTKRAPNDPNCVVHLMTLSEHLQPDPIEAIWRIFEVEDFARLSWLKSVVVVHVVDAR